MQSGLVQSVGPDLPHFANIADHATGNGVGVDPNTFLIALFSGEAVVVRLLGSRLPQEYLECRRSGVGVQEPSEGVLIRGL